MRGAEVANGNRAPDHVVVHEVVHGSLRCEVRDIGRPLQRDPELEFPAAQHFQAFAGKGIRAQVEGCEVVLGTRAMMESYGISLNGLSETADSLAQMVRRPCSSRLATRRLA